MISQSLRSAARIERLQQPLEVAAIHGETTLILGIQDPLSLDGGAGDSARLGPCRILLSLAIAACS